MSAAKTIKPALAVGDTVTWKGPRNFGGKPISGVVRHIGKLFVTVRSLGSRSGQSGETYIRRADLLTINGASVPGSGS